MTDSKLPVAHTDFLTIFTFTYKERNDTVSLHGMPGESFEDISSAQNCSVYHYTPLQWFSTTSMCKSFLGLQRFDRELLISATRQKTTTVAN